MTKEDAPPALPTLKELIDQARKREIGLLGPQVRIAPYTGITGFMSREDVALVTQEPYTIGGFGGPTYAGRQIMIGVLASWKTLSGEPRGLRRRRYPEIGRIREILDAAAEPYHHRSPWQPETEGTVFDMKERCLGMIHYTTKEPDLFAQLERLCDVSGDNLGGFQLNMAWPPEKDVRWWSQGYPGLRLVLQVNRKMFADVERNPRRLADEIERRYAPWITDILFDMSGGAGAPIDLKEAEDAIAALYESFPDYGIGLAGGLDPNTIWSLKPFFDRWPRLSINAEGRLRRPEDDSLDHEKARQYVQRACGVMPLHPAESKTAQ